MAVATRSFTTGPSTLPDIGELSYNGCVFSPLFETHIYGAPSKDRANRTIKYVEYTITADGYATLPTGASSVNGVMDSLRDLLNAPAGQLTYRGRGFDMSINAPGGGGRRDVAWGPIPDLIEFQPLGGGRSAKVRWQVKVCLPEQSITVLVNRRGAVPTSLLQFNFDTSVTYAEDGYSGISIKGTMEIPMTRLTQSTRTLAVTADDFRSAIESRVISGIDLSRFRVTKRTFSVSRDKRTLEWDVAAEELPYMDMPPDCTIARGMYSVRPAKVGMGLALWLCTLKATYTVRADRPRRTAWFAFLALLRLRMSESRFGNVPAMNGNQNPVNRALRRAPGLLAGGFISGGIQIYKDIFNKQGAAGKSGARAFLIDFTIDEGLYLDSKTVAFSATWRLVTTFSHILIASGLWKKLPELDVNNNNVWAISMKDISGSQSWLSNSLNPDADIIVDFGG